MKHNTFRKIICVLLVCLMMCTSVPMVSFAADAPIQCYVNGEPSTDSLYNIINEATPGTVIVLADTFTKWPAYFEPELMVKATDTLTIDFNGMTFNKNIDVWPDAAGNKGRLILRNGTIIAPEDSSAIHVSNNIYVDLYDMEVYGQLDANKYNKLPTLCVYSGYYHDGNHDPYYTYSTPNNIKVYGGVWDYKVSSFLDKGYEMVEHTDGKFYVEEVGEISFETDETGAYLIKTVTDLQNIRRSVNAGTSYQGKTFKLCNDLDLTGLKWTPIGREVAPFSGNFDGQGHTISNLYVNENMDNIGLFGFTRYGSIKNLTVHNPTVIGSDKNANAGALAGKAYSDFVIDNVHITGKIAVETGYYVGGISGGYTYAHITNCTVDGENDEEYPSYFKATRYTTVEDEGVTNYVGGICGLYGEKAKGIYNCSVSNVNIIATEYGAGGILGVIQYGTIVRDCEVKNVKFYAQKSQDTLGWTGSVIGKANYGATEPISQIINCNVQYEAYIGSNPESQEIKKIGLDFSSTSEPIEQQEPPILIGDNVTYDENGKITGGIFEPVNVDFTSQKVKNLLADDVVFVTNEDGTVGTELGPCREIDENGNVVTVHNKFIVEGTRVEPTCVDKGYEGDISCDCGETNEQGKVLDPTGTHTFETYVYNNDADCSKDGTETSTCKYCNEATHTRNALNTRTEDHTFSLYVYNNDSTCSSDGTKTAICDRCGRGKDTVEAPGTLDKSKHKFGPYVYNNDATCALDGSETSTCIYCHNVRTIRRSLGTATGEHVFTKYKSDRNATCVKNRTETALCDTCGIATDTREVANTMTGIHVYSKYEYNEDATCTENGTMTAKCDMCGLAGDTVEAPKTALGHSDEDNNGYCDICGISFIKDDCFCHRKDNGSLAKIAYKVMLIIWRVFGINRTCACGENHY